MIAPAYRKQVELLLAVLPFVAKEKVFALKGGTAINMFDRDMPRLSVDIDLAYTPLNDRDRALKEIDAALHRLKTEIERNIAGVSATFPHEGEKEKSKLICSTPETQVKIEVNTVIRGNLFPLRQLDISRSVEEEFECFASITVLSRAELYGGKICAALDRQHPRDLFDIHHLFTEGLTDEIRIGFLLMLLSHPRPMHELLAPTMTDRAEVFSQQFAGMSRTPYSYSLYDATRKKLAGMLPVWLTQTEKEFLIGFKSGTPDWELFPAQGIATMPAIRWKLLNIRRLKEQNPSKHQALARALEKVLNRTGSE